MVKNVEELAAELDGEPFVNRGGLREGGVPLSEAGTAASVATQITILAGRRGSERGRVDLRMIRIPRSIGTRKRERLSCQVGANLINAQEWRSDRDVVWQAAASLEKAADLPTLGQTPRQGRCHWKIPDCAEREVVANIDIATGVVEIGIVRILVGLGEDVNSVVGFMCEGVVRVQGDAFGNAAAYADLQ